MRESLKILVVRFSSIGDIVLTSPVVRCLKTQIGAEVHFITKEKYKSILVKNPHIDQVHTISDEVSEIISKLNSEKYDYIIDLHNNLRSHTLGRLRVKCKRFSKLNIKKFILTTFGINLLPNLHVVDRYMETVNFLGVKNDNKGLDYFISEEDRVFLKLNGEQLNQYIAFVIGGQHKTKMLPLEKIIGICSKLDGKIVLIGDHNDKKNGDCIVNGVGKNVYNACGKYSINQSAFLISKSDYVISHDTGMMHIASAFKKKIYAIFGSTTPDFGMSPYMSDPESEIIEVKGLNCRPCSKIGFEKCPKNHFKCMNEIREDLFFRK